MTEKVDDKDLEITDKVIFDDSFDWESFDERAQTKVSPNEKLAELDLMEVEDDDLFPGKKPQPKEQGSDQASFGFRRESTPDGMPSAKTSEGLSRSKIRIWVAAGVLFVILPIVILGTWLKITSSRQIRQAVRTDQITREIQSSVQELVPMKPFMVPVSKNEVNAFLWVSPTLVVQSYKSYLIKEQMEAIRGEVFNALNTSEHLGRNLLNGNKLAKLIRGRINGYLGSELVEGVRIVIKDPIITNYKATNSSDYS
jgi:hypothetical protein